MTTNPDTLFQEANCFRCNSNASEADLLELALLDRISTAASSDSTPGLPLTSVQFNDGGVFGGDADFTWNKTTNLLSITGGIALTGEANETQLAVTGHSLTGANAQSMVSLAGTWNTTGAPTAIDLNITDTASAATSLLMNLRTGGTTRFSVDRLGKASAARMLVGDGTAAAPSIAFTTDDDGTGHGFYRVSASETSLAINGVQIYRFLSSTFVMALATVRIDAAAADLRFNNDTAIRRQAAGILEVNDTNLGTFRTIQAILKTSVNATASGAVVNTHTIPITDASGTVYRCLCLV